MKRPKSWVNGRITDAAKAAVPVSDRGFLYGDGVFETMRAYAGTIFMADAHLDRMFRSMALLKIKPPFPKAALKEAMSRCLAVNGLSSACVRLTVTRGCGISGMDVSPRFKANAVIVVNPLSDDPGTSVSRAISASVVRNVRQDEHSPLSNVKSLNYMNRILARMDARRRGFDEAIILNTKGHVTEGASSNIFIVKGGRLITPSVDSGILPGVTRDIVIKIARRLRIRVEERAVFCREFLDADEVFITNSIKEVVPVARIDRHAISRFPGEITKLISISCQKEVIRHTLIRR